MVTDDPAGDRPSADDTTNRPVPEPNPLPIPDLFVVDDVSTSPQSVGELGSADGFPATTPGGAPDDAANSGTVTDEDRTRYGLLLDRAAERGLLGAYDYEIRLRDLASATTIDQMNHIVTELPVFTATSGTRANKPRRKGSSDRPLGTLGPSGGRSRRANPWLVLAIVVIVVVASLVFLSVYTHHLVRNRPSGLPTPPVATRSVSGLRL
jgi:hypothetical protein